jgi:hypothetical protein
MTWYSSSVRRQLMPFVSSAALAAMQKHLDQTREDLHASRAEVSRLTETIVQLKRQGFHPPEPMHAPPALVPASPVDEAIRALPRQHQGNVMREVKRWREDGRMTEDEILRRVQLGEEAYQEAG